MGMALLSNCEGHCMGIGIVGEDARSEVKRTWTGSKET